MPFDLELPDGTLLQDIPDGTTKEQILAKFPNLNAQNIPNQDTEAVNRNLVTGGYDAVGSQLGNQGPVGAAVQGFNQTVPFGERLTAGGAALAVAPFTDDTISELYDAARQSQKVTAENNPNAVLAGNVAGIGATLPLAFSKAASSTPILGNIANGLQKTTTGATRFIKGSPLPAKGIGSSIANAGGRAGRSSLIAAPSGFVYGYGAGDEGERVDNGLQSAGVGSAVAGALPLAGAVLGGAANAAIPKIDDATASLAARAREFGIPLRVDQVSPTRARNTLQKVSQEIPGSGVNSFDDTQKLAFNRAIAKTIGQDADALTPDVINKYLDDAGQKFGSALKGTSINFDNVALSRIDDIFNNADVTDDVAGIVQKNIQRLKKDIGGNRISGEKLASYRSDLIKRIPKADSQARPYLSEIVDVIDDISEKNLSPEAADILRQARREYRNFKTIEPLLEKSTNGDINPTQLLQRVSASPYIKASRSELGNDELVDLARIGKEFLPQKGGSDTFQKAALGGVGTAAVLEPTTMALTGGTMLGNRVFQKGYNQSQGVIDKILTKSGKISPAELKKLPKQEQIEVLNALKQITPSKAEELQAVFEGRKLNKR